VGTVPCQDVSGIPGFFWGIKEMRGDGLEDYLEGRERIDLIKTARPQWMNLHVSDTGRLDEFFDHTGIELGNDKRERVLGL
jgi:hypothetical protein